MSVRTETPGFARRSGLLEAAYRAARDAHHGPRRQGDTDIEHPATVAELLLDAGYPEEVVAAGLLHDVVEDTSASNDEIRSRFGPRVAALVAALTEDESIDPYEARKAAHRRQVIEAGGDAAAIFAADKLASVRRLVRRGEDVAPEKLDHYMSTLEMLHDAFPELPFLPALRRELGALARAQ